MPVNENMVQEIVQAVMAKMQIAEAPSGKHGVFKDMNEAIEAAKKAELIVKKMSMDQREKIITCIRKKIRENAEILARMGVDETGMGNVGDKILKVIIETCLLTEEEKIGMCQAVTAAGADYIKTSTGFSKAGATSQDVELFARYVGEDVKIKAAGGISSLADAERFLELGADRLGTSRIVKIAKEL